MNLKNGSDFSCVYLTIAFAVFAQMSEMWTERKRWKKNTEQNVNIKIISIFFRFPSE